MAELQTTRRPLGAVFLLSVLICGVIGLWGVLAPDALAGAANTLTGFALTTLDWIFLMLCTGFVVLGGVLALGPYGRIKLGADDDEPEFSTSSGATRPGSSRRPSAMPSAAGSSDRSPPRRIRWAWWR
jgi:choline-glycine betaine transporter